MEANLYRMRTTSGRILYVWDDKAQHARNVVRGLLNPEDGIIVACGVRKLESLPALRQQKVA